MGKGGYCEGKVNDKQGWFPYNVVEEPKLNTGMHQSYNRPQTTMHYFTCTGSSPELPVSSARMDCWESDNEEPQSDLGADLTNNGEKEPKFTNKTHYGEAQAPITQVTNSSPHQDHHDEPTATEQRCILLHSITE